MTLQWTGWQPPADPGDAELSPYIDWFRETETPRAAALGLQLVTPDGGGDPVALPAVALPVSGSGQEGNVLPYAPADAVILGIIDTGIALAHERFRSADGGTRFLCAWQQGAAHRGQALAFGRELLKDEIDTLMQINRAGGVVDEAAFNRAAGLVSFLDPGSDREIERNAAHGTHVLDLAAGLDPAQPGQGARLPIIAATLPPRPSVGASGTFLEYFVIEAMDYILRRADAIWQAHHAGQHQGASGFPVVINLSYGLQAGPKDGSMALERHIAALMASRRAEGRAPLRIILPAGNDNAERGQVRLTASEAGSDPLIWRLQPDDLTPNYAEFWSDPCQGPADPSQPHPFGVQINVPGCAPGDAAPGVPGQFRDLIYGCAPTQPLARLYCRRTAPAEGVYRHNYVLCTRATQDFSLRPAPSGAWELCLFGPDIGVQLSVQSDQSLNHGASTGRLAYFDHPAFHLNTADGHPADTTDYPATGQPMIDDPGPVQRRNTLNAIASLPDCAVVGGYRRSDGRPVGYSSSARAGAAAPGRDALTAALPSDDSVALFGLLAAGAKSGSVAALQGTSFATALASRLVVASLLEWHAAGRDPASDLGSPAWLEAAAAMAEQTAPFPGRVHPVKAGAGRLDIVTPGRIARMGGY